MKRLAVKKGVECMACLQCVRACSEAFYKEFHQDKACIRIVEKNGAAKPMTCVQCGKCKEVCPFGVLVKVPEAPTSSKCIACGICVKACPMEVLEIVEK